MVPRPFSLDKGKQKPWVDPSTLLEMGFTASLTAVGAICYAFLVGEFTAMVQLRLGAWKRRDAQTAAIRTLCRLRRVPR